MFGPKRPHWLEKAAHGFKRHQQVNLGQSSLATSIPPPIIYTNAVYFFNQRASAAQPPSSLRLDIISHVFYAFASLGSDGVVSLSDPEKDVQMAVDGAQGCMQAFQLLKQRHSHLKLILSVGGASGSSNFAAVAADPVKRVTCAATVRSLIDQYGFDGVDVDWEHPEAGEQSLHYIHLLADLRNRLPVPRYLLTTALPAGEWVLAKINLREAARYLDLLNLMAYDFCGDWEPRISGHQAQLLAPKGGGHSHVAINYVLSQGLKAEKIILGCPAYGWAFLGCTDVNQPSRACGGNGGTFDYRDLPRPGTEEQVDREAVAAFCVGGDGGFVTYDNPETVQAKAKYAKSNGLGGLFFWHGTADAQGSRSLVYASYTELHSEA